MKKFLFILTLISFAFNLSSKAISFYSINNGDTIYYNIGSSTYPYTVEVTNNGDMIPDYSGQIIIPDSVLYQNNYYLVTSIGNFAFQNCTQLTSISIPQTITHIGEYAFENCSSITSINFPENISFIGETAFNNCSALTTIYYNAINCNYMGSNANKVFNGCPNINSIVFGNSVRRIPPYAFYGLNGVSIINLPDSINSIGNCSFFGLGITEITLNSIITNIGTWAFKNCFLLQTVNFNSVNCIYMGDQNNPVFDSCNNLNTIYFGNNVHNIPSYAFAKCSGLTSLNLPNSINIIGDYSFFNCVGLTNINLPVSISLIGNNAFANCNLITSVLIPDSVINIDESAFANCISLNTVTYNSRLFAFMGSSSSPVFTGCVNLRNLIIGDSVKNIPSFAFMDCYGLNNLYLGENIITIGQWSFKNCTSLTKLTYKAKNPTYIGNNNYEAFSGCSNIKTLIIGDSVQIIPNYAFDGLTGLDTIYYNAKNCSIQNNNFTNLQSLKTIYFGTDVNSIPDNAFSNCPQLSFFEFPNSITYIGNYSFSNCSSISSVSLPYHITYIGIDAFSNCSSLSSVIYNPINCSYMGAFSHEVFKGCNNLHTLSIGDSVINLPTYGFSGIAALNNLNFNSINLQYTYSNFTNNTSINTLNIGENVQSIPNFAFSGCSGINIVNFPNSVNNIGAGAFYGCSSLTSINLPNSITTIEVNTFRNCSSLTSLFIPNSVITIGNFAFDGCSSIHLINCNATTPPSIFSNSFYNAYDSITLLIPCNSILNYISAPFWNNFTNKREYDNCIYSISVLSEDTTKGLVYGGGNYPFGNIQIYATPKENCVFMQWNDGDTNLNRIIQVSKDSIFIAKFKKVVRNDITNIICQGDTYIFFDSTLTQTGVYNHTIQVEQNYDSIINLNLIVNPVFRDTIYAIICQGEIYNQNGFNESFSGIYTQTLQTYKGCDSIIVLSLQVNELSTPTNLSLINLSHSIEINWQGNNDNYIVYRNNDSLALVNHNIYRDSNVVEGENYCYKIRAINNQCISEFSQEECLTYSSFDRIKKNTLNIIIQPNPSSNMIKIISSFKINNIVIYNTLGQKIIEKTINGNNTELDVSKFTKGNYITKIYTDNGVLTKKIIVE